MNAAAHGGPRGSGMLSRREFGGCAAAAASAIAAFGCGGDNAQATRGAAVLSARPVATETTALPGLRALDTGGPREALLYVPPDVQGPLPLLVLLHGAGGSGAGILERLEAVTQSHDAVILAPQSLGRTWDALTGGPQTLLDAFTFSRSRAGFGPDVQALDGALRRVFESVLVDSSRIVVGGFSDGATYALSLGLANGDLFRRVVAFSPGFVVDDPRLGAPEIFVSHGRADTVLPIDRCSRRIVAVLRGAGYSVTYREFDGGHEVPEAIAREALAWAMR